jgi:dihydrofolate reductase
VKNNLDIRLIYTQDCLGGTSFGCSIPWHLKADLKRFKELTEGGIIIAESQIWESLPKGFCPLKNKVNIIVSQEEINVIKKENSVYFINMQIFKDKILNYLEGVKEIIWIIGGDYLFDFFLPYTNTIERTLVYGAFKCDSFVKPIDLMKWQCLKKETHIENSRLFEFETFKRK